MALERFVIICAWSLSVCWFMLRRSIRAELFWAGFICRRPPEINKSFVVVWLAPIPQPIIRLMVTVTSTAAILNIIYRLRLSRCHREAARASCHWIFRQVTQDHSRSLKMVLFEKKLWASFLLAFHNNYGRIFSRLDTIHERDGQTPHDGIDHVFACIARRKQKRTKSHQNEIRKKYFFASEQNFVTTKSSVVTHVMCYSRNN